MNVTLGDSWIIDALRVVTVILGGALVAVTIVRFIDWKRQTQAISIRAQAIAFLIFAVLTCAQEGQQIGKPFVIWRLPLLILGVTAGLVTVVAQDREWRKPPPEPES